MDTSKEYIYISHILIETSGDQSVGSRREYWNIDLNIKILTENIEEFRKSIAVSWSNVTDFKVVVSFKIDDDWC